LRLCGFACDPIHAAERARRFEDCLTQSREAAKGAVPVEIERLATIAVDCGFSVHRDLGPGLLESVYEAVLAYNLGARGLAVAAEAGANTVAGGDPR
jgi:hypothetical protein